MKPVNVDWKTLNVKVTVSASPVHVFVVPSSVPTSALTMPHVPVQSRTILLMCLPSTPLNVSVPLVMSRYQLLLYVRNSPSPSTVTVNSPPSSTVPSAMLPAVMPSMSANTNLPVAYDGSVISTSPVFWKYT